MNASDSQMHMVWRSSSEPYDLCTGASVPKEHLALVQLLCMHYDLMGLKCASVLDLTTIEALQEFDRQKTLQERLTDPIGINPMQLLCDVPKCLEQQAKLSLLAKQESGAGQASLQVLFEGISAPVAVQMLEAVHKQVGHNKLSLCLAQDSVIVALMERRTCAADPQGALVREALSSTQWSQAQTLCQKVQQEYEQDQNWLALLEAKRKGLEHPVPTASATTGSCAVSRKMR